MDLSNKIKNGEEKIAVIGLGYVGMPIAIEFDKKDVKVVGFDINAKKIEEYKSGIDMTDEVGNEMIKKSNVYFTSDENDLDGVKFFIVAVPTPINDDKTPNLDLVESASKIVAKHISKGAVVVFESTVYPGVTENICAPVLEEYSNLEVGKDFKIGYSPERINPGDKKHRLNNITKIVSGCDEESLKCIKDVYDIVIETTYPVSNIKTAEAIKVVENSQRDINIAFMNELAMVFDRMGIDTNEVVAGMNTKWNALGFKPGLVGGHCIGVDPYYFTYEAEKLGYHSQIIISGRKVNDGMGEFVADAIIKKLVLGGFNVKNSNIIILGITFKENCPDIRNSKVIDIINRLSEYGINPKIYDPYANKEEAKKVYNIDLIDKSELAKADCIVFAVAHDVFENMDVKDIEQLYDKKLDNKVLIDVKSMFNKKEMINNGFDYWNL